MTAEDLASICFCLFLHRVVKVLDPPGSGRAPAAQGASALGNSKNVSQVELGEHATLPSHSKRRPGGRTGQLKEQH